jgi:hypothetical protein
MIDCLLSGGNHKRGLFGGITEISVEYLRYPNVKEYRFTEREKLF